MVNGAELYFEEEGLGTPILLLHGNGANSMIWGGTIGDLAKVGRVIAVDRRGFGQSSGPLAKDFRQQADDAAVLLGALDAEPAVVVGWSGGGTVALDLAARYPGSVSSLVLAEPGLHLLRNVSFGSLAMTAKVEALRRVRRDERGAARAMERWALRYTTGGTAWDKFPPDWQESMQACAPAVMREIDQLARLYPTTEQVKSISHPVTCVEGTVSDPAFHKADRQLLKLLPATKLVEVEGASHAIHFDRPDEFAAAVAESVASAADPANAA